MISRRKQDTYYFTESKLGDSPNIPLALVLGWAGSIDSNVSKYSKIYEDFGYHTIRFSPNTISTLIQVQNHKSFAYELLRLIDETHNLTNNPIIVHTFSNAGLFIYRFFSEIIHNEAKYARLRDKVKCLIMDSGPGWPESTRALIQNVSVLVSSQINIPYIGHLIAIIGFAVFMIRHKFFIGSNYFTSFFQSLVKDKNEVPILLFYSKQDRLLSYKDALRFIEDRHKHSPNVSLFTYEFMGTEHVSHYQKHPKEYRQRIEEHIRICDLPILNISNAKI
jgi:hypothetical protein